MRKAVQIAVQPESDNAYAVLYVLFDDGTIWETWQKDDHPRQWAELDNYPTEAKP